MKHTTPGCVLVVMAEGFEEIETITLLTLLRQAGVCAKSVGLTSGLVGSVHGIWVMPDLTLAEVDSLTKTMLIDAVILPDGGQGLIHLETDPRLHRWLGQVAARGGKIAMSHQTKRVLDTVWAGSAGPGNPLLEAAVLVREDRQSAESLAHHLIHLRNEHEIHS